VLSCAGAEPLTNRLAFIAAANKGYEFDTGVLKGKVRPGGFGISQLLHAPSSNMVVGCYGLFSPFATTSNRFPTGLHAWPCTQQLHKDGALETHWPVAGEIPFELTARCWFSAKETLDAEFTVKPRLDLPGFELFLNSYFGGTFSNVAVYVQDRGRGIVVPRFQWATRANGEWQMYPREPAVLGLINDGRWTGSYRRNWDFMPLLAQPLVMRQSARPALTALLIAAPEDCFAIATYCQAESKFGGPNSTSLSLFGRDLKAGKMARARVRFVLLEHPTELQILEAYYAYPRDLRY
jgi:hypothetical protein